MEQLTGQKKKKKDKSALIRISGYKQMKVERLCISKLQTIEKYSVLFCRYGSSNFKI